MESAIAKRDFCSASNLKSDAQKNTLPCKKFLSQTFCDRINFGTFYTSQKYVQLVAKWLFEEGVFFATIFDPSCGEGAFFSLKVPNAKYEFVGNDIDKNALQKAKKNFPNVKFFNKNIFTNFSKDDYEIPKNVPLVIVGNPPYNDTTSQINQKAKQKSKMEFSPKVKSRDLGISSLLSYEQMQAEYVAVLHPLSYLIKRANFFRLKKFFSSYKLLRHLVFSSQEFFGTSKLSGFPVVVTFYKKGGATFYEEILQTQFYTSQGKKFCVSDWDYVSPHIKKYPSKNRYEPQILFYTLRDINALRRSRTFLASRTKNAVDIPPEKFSYYCYIDCFKRYAREIPYYMGNLDIPFCEKTFSKIERHCVLLSKHFHAEVFGENPFSQESEKIVKEYVEEILQR